MLTELLSTERYEIDHFRVKYFVFNVEMNSFLSLAYNCYYYVEDSLNKISGLLLSRLV